MSKRLPSTLIPTTVKKSKKESHFLYFFLSFLRPGSGAKCVRRPNFEKGTKFLGRKISPFSVSDFFPRLHLPRNQVQPRKNGVLLFLSDFSVSLSQTPPV